MLIHDKTQLLVQSFSYCFGVQTLGGWGGCQITQPKKGVVVSESLGTPDFRALLLQNKAPKAQIVIPNTVDHEVDNRI